MTDIRAFPKVSYLNVPSKLRELADAVERAQTGNDPFRAVVIVLCYPNGRVAVRGYGEETSPLQMSGWLARAQTAMTEHYCADCGGDMGAPPPAA